MLQLFHPKVHLGSEFHKNCLSFSHPQTPGTECVCAPSEDTDGPDTLAGREAVSQDTAADTAPDTKGLQGLLSPLVSEATRTWFSRDAAHHHVSQLLVMRGAPSHHKFRHLAHFTLSPTQAANCTALDNRSEDVSCACVSFPTLGLAVFPCLEDQGSLNLSTCPVCLVSRDIPHAGKVFLYSPGQARGCKFVQFPFVQFGLNTGWCASLTHSPIDERQGSRIGALQRNNCLDATLSTKTDVCEIPSLLSQNQPIAVFQENRLFFERSSLCDQKTCSFLLTTRGRERKHLLPTANPQPESATMYCFASFASSIAFARCVFKYCASSFNVSPDTLPRALRRPSSCGSLLNTHTETGCSGPFAWASAFDRPSTSVVSSKSGATLLPEHLGQWVVDRLQSRSVFSCS